ncbi:MAG: transposase [Clostridiales bacterium]|jgi:transposase|nr:transposase [Clostridiales bacterium]
MHKYPSDISREEFELVRGVLKSARKTTKPRKVDLYDIFCAVLYIVKGGTQWRMLPKDFPKCQTVYFYFQIWTKTNDSGFSILESALKKIDWSRS